MALGEVYDVPPRWGKRTDEIGEKLFRRMRNYCGLAHDLGTLDENSDVIDLLDQLLCILYDEEMAREPFAFPMTWWLAKLVNEECTDKEVGKVALLTQEIKSWLAERGIDRSAMQERGREIRRIIGTTAQ